MEEFDAHGGAEGCPRFVWETKFPVPRLAAIALLALAVASATGAGADEGNDPAARPASGRLAPPPVLQCDRNQLTSYSGTVTGYERTDEQTRIAITTDWGSVESFTLHHPDGRVEELFLLWGEPFKLENWRQIETAPGDLIEGLQAIVWICEESSVGPVVDWRPGEKARSQIPH
jgi:hypothetical protein